MTKSGWLQNKARRERRDRPNTLRDQDVMDLIKKIEVMEYYTKLREPWNKYIKMRDKALISLSWIFFKRANETLSVKLGDVYFEAKKLEVTFRIGKKRKRIKKCLNCGTKNAKGAKYCRTCGKDLSLVSPSLEGEQRYVVVKRKSMSYPFCRIFVKWVVTLKELGCVRECYIFPPYRYFGKCFRFDKHLTCDRFNQILQRLDNTLTSHMFRYGASEKFLRKGYTVYELQEIGDWSSIIMPSVYAKRKGLTKIQRIFAEDIEMAGKRI